MDRNWWSKLFLGRSSPDAVQRSAGRQWLRWWGCGSAFLALAVGIPILIFGTYNYDQNLRENGVARTAQVTKVDPANAGARFTVKVDGKDVELSNPKLKPKVGEGIGVVVAPDGRVVLADDAGAKDKAFGDAAFGVFLGFLVLIVGGWGPGLAPYRAVKSVRVPELLKQSTIVTLTAVEKVRPPQGAVYGAWRRGTGAFYDVDLQMPDKRIARWRGRLAKAPEVGSKASMVGGGFPDDWVVLVTNIKQSDAEAVNWPAVPLCEPMKG